LRGEKEEYWDERRRNIGTREGGILVGVKKENKQYWEERRRNIGRRV